MKPEIKEKWLEALRSGEYEQGMGWLKAEGKYCCLGVLCDISGLGTWDSESAAYEHSGELYVTSGDSHDQELPQTVAIWAGLDVIGPVVLVDPYRVVSLAGLNDSAESIFVDDPDEPVHDFRFIADVIEEYL